MISVGGAERHFWLTQGIARVLGVNLTGAMATGALDSARYAEIVQICENCKLFDFCAAWMAQQRGTAETAPEFCANKPAFDRLQAKTR